MPKVIVDQVEIDVPSGMTVLQACELAGKEIPRFCYHERLSIAGNCRMCLVEVENAPKPVASCAMPVADNMVIRTDSDMVQKARQGVMEFLLINHPLDCPICDQGGECDLQDQAMVYGYDKSRFKENKRAVDNKDLGPLISTTMTRCIHCTRCVRFITECAGSQDLGSVGRGEHMEIDNVIERAIDSELSGNIIDLCPVGALTSKPYAFTARSWELKKTESVDVMDAVGSNICLGTRGQEVMRITPIENDGVNEEWISDKARFHYDGLLRQRIDKAYAKEHGRLQQVTFDDALYRVAKSIRSLDDISKQAAFLVGDMVDCESIYSFKKFADQLGVQHLDADHGCHLPDQLYRHHYVMNSGIDGIDEADFCLLVGANIRHDAPVLSARLYQNINRRRFDIYTIGDGYDFKYPAKDLGVNPQILYDILSGEHALSSAFEAASKPMIIIGSDAMKRQDAPQIMKICQDILAKYNALSGFGQSQDSTSIDVSPESDQLRNDAWNGFNILHKNASAVGALDLGFYGRQRDYRLDAIKNGVANGDIKYLYLLGFDAIDFDIPEDVTVVYQGHHGDKGASVADVILPSACYHEKDGTYVNTEGRVQRGQRATFPIGEAKSDWAIFRALSEYCGVELPFDSFMDVHAAMVAEHPHLSNIGLPAKAHKIDWQSIAAGNNIASDSLFVEPPKYYLTNVIARASRVMAECTQTFDRLKKEAAFSSSYDQGIKDRKAFLVDAVKEETGRSAHQEIKIE